MLQQQQRLLFLWARALLFNWMERERKKNKKPLFAIYSITITDTGEREKANSANVFGSVFLLADEQARAY